MKKSITTTVLMLISALVIAQDHTKDEESINKQVDAMIYSWNHHDYEDLKNYTTENTDWVNGVGMWWKGRKESKYAHQVLHNTMFKESVCERKSVLIRFLTTDVAIAHLYWHFSAFTDPTGKAHGADDCIATLVYIKQNEKWLMTAGENLAIMEGVQQFDPITQMPKN